jgi:hypothetical protein
MAIAIEFQSCRIATLRDSEDACLVLADGVVMALLVRLDGDATIKPGWFLQIGFGPCDQEGIVFETLEDAAAWVEQRLVPRTDQRRSVCLTVDASGGFKSRSARGPGPISEGGGNASPAREDGRYGEASEAQRRKPGNG